MKLYTEEQMKRCFNDAQVQWYNTNYMYPTFEQYLIACNSTPIELPSDKEIEKFANHKWRNVHRTGVLGCIEGAKWVVEQIKQQAK